LVLELHGAGRDVDRDVALATLVDLETRGKELVENPFDLGIAG
jgi:hypothetical protein